MLEWQRLLGRLLLRSCGLVLAPAVWRFRRALIDPAEAQMRVLREIVAACRETDYGKRWRLKRVADFKALPVVDYEDLRPEIEAPREDGGSRICPGRVIGVEATSGSSGAKKLIPYNKALRRSFTEMFAAWADDLIIHGPGLSAGRLYFSISPRLKQGSDNEISSSFASDADYLSGLTGWLSARFFLNTSDLARMNSGAEFQEALALRLLAAKDLELVSVWNPSFFAILLDRIAAGGPELRRRLDPRGGDRRLASLSEAEPDWRAIWPELKLISCWASGHAAGVARRLAERMPGLALQPKGLLATEAPISIPLCRAPEPGLSAPMLSEVYLELEDSSGAICDFAEARAGEDYQLIISTRGGLLRYRLGDLIRLEPEPGMPWIRFLGRAGGGVDLVGEKLHEGFVQSSLEPFFDGQPWSLVPLLSKPGYILVFEESTRSQEELAARAEHALRASHHYNLARELGQLQALELLPLRSLESRLGEAWVASGRRLGDFKARALQDVALGEALFAGLRAELPQRGEGRER